MAITASQEQVFNWLKGSGRTQTKKESTLSGFNFILRGGSFRRIASKFANEIGLNKVTDGDLITPAIDVPDWPDNHPNVADDNTQFSLPYKLSRIMVDPEDNTKAHVNGGGDYIYDRVEVFDITDEEKNAGLEAIDQVGKGLVTDVLSNEISEEFETNDDTDFSLFNQLEDISQLKTEQVTDLRADSDITTAIATVRTDILAAIAADLVLEEAHKAG